MRTALLAAAAVLTVLPARAQDPGAEPISGSVELEEGFLPDPHAVDLVAGGTVEPAVDGCAFGVVAEAPDYDLYYTTSGSTDLYIYAFSDEDTTLLVNLPDGSWACDDDGYDIETGDPLLVIPAAEAGLYDIWVGTYGEEPAEATLFISEVDPQE